MLGSGRRYRPRDSNSSIVNPSKGGFMESMLLDVAGHRRSPATMPGYHRGRPPRNKGEQYPADPPTVEEIVAVMRTIGDRADATDCARSSFYSGAPDCESAKPSHSRKAIWTDPAAPYSSGAGRAASAGRSGWIAGRGSNSIRGWRSVASFPSARGAVRDPRTNRRTRWEASAARKQLHHAASAAGVRRRFAPHQLRHAHAVEMAHEGVPLVVIQRQLGHANLGITSVYLQGIDSSEIISTVHGRPSPTISATAGLELTR
jgi:Phage integrase family